ncbi:MAG TPA: hypothetical protein VK804_27265 [Bradyrhizobium sp.]|jgi:hypothetical protein|uniref:hypothetical protein n=1 Tax=Bradyrhizobium sp. TaxID=376 RepID=UPI002CC190B8|nr:hypothetical protein [Bradyrhizobium sp.]HTB04183.1 hypothetical protein [Bradyrhizobium sp.]
MVAIQVQNLINFVAEVFGHANSSPDQGGGLEASVIVSAAKQSIAAGKKEWIASSLSLLAMTA